MNSPYTSTKLSERDIKLYEYSVSLHFFAPTFSKAPPVLHAIEENKREQAVLLYLFDLHYGTCPHCKRWYVYEKPMRCPIHMVDLYPMSRREFLAMTKVWDAFRKTYMERFDLKLMSRRSTIILQHGMLFGEGSEP